MKKKLRAFFDGVAPQTPKSKKRYCQRFLPLPRSRGLTHSHAPAAPWLAQGAFEVAHRQPGAGDSLWDNRAPGVREGAFGKYSP